MAQVINIADTLGTRARRGWYLPHDLSTKSNSHMTEADGQPPVTKENIFRAILLLDLAAQQARLLLKNIADPSRRRSFEAQVVVIEESLQHARDLALKL